jgi:uncharacterized protein (DUF433 family)/DNA-binding transcriptional MerR regulator
MTTLVSERSGEPWRRRLFLPSYQISEAARYSGISPQTVVAWHKQDETPMLSTKEKREALSYMQLIEVAVVAAFRKAGIKLSEIRAAREYAKKEFKAEHPFAVYRFKSEGKDLWMEYEQIEGERARGTLLKANQAGQLAWSQIIGRLNEFEYECEGIVIRWHVAGSSSPIVIDPRLSFGAPTIRGTPTWVIKGRWDAGETDADIAEDFGLEKDEVRKALDFELVGSGRGKAKLKLH